MSISGSSVSLGGYYEPTNDSSDVVGMVYDPDNNCVVAFVRFNAGSYSGRIMSINLTASGSSVTGGSWQTVEQHNIHNFFTASYDEEQNRIVVAYAQTTTNGSLYGKIGQGNSSSYSWGSKTTIGSGLDISSQRGFSCYDANAKRVVIGWTNGSNSAKAVSVGGTGYSYTLGTIGEILTHNNRFSSQNNNNIATYYPTGGGIMFGYSDTSTNSQPSTRLMTTANVTSNVNANNFVGFANNSIGSGGSVTVNVSGATTDWTASSLTAGSYYYVKGDGTLDTSGVAGAGVALSSTKLLIK